MNFPPLLPNVEQNGCNHTRRTSLAIPVNQRVGHLMDDPSFYGSDVIAAEVYLMWSGYCTLVASRTNRKMRSY